MSSDRARAVAVSLAAACLLALTVAPAKAQDPVKVAGDQYKVITENDSIRVLDVKMAPGAKAAMHSHPDVTVVVLEAGKVKWTRPDGTSTQSGPEFKRGAIQSMKAESHSVENLGTSAVHVVLIEYKKPAPATGKARSPSLTPPYKQLADDPHARAFEVTVSPGGAVPQHTHGDHVIVSLSDSAAEVTDKNGKKEAMSFKKDTAMVWGPTTHSAINSGKTPVHLIVVEMK